MRSQAEAQATGTALRSGEVQRLESRLVSHIMDIYSPRPTKCDSTGDLLDDDTSLLTAGTTDRHLDRLLANKRDAKAAAPRQQSH